jgi:ureidoglycolate lyase
MEQRILKPEPLTPAGFAPYGDVIECATAAEQRHINYGHTIRFHDLARLDLEKDGGRPLVSIFRSTPLERPVPIKVMERHPLSSQAFYPLSGLPYLVVVADRGDFDPATLKAFLARPDQGVNYQAGTWHHYCLALEGVSEFLVIDRGGPEKNCDEVFIKEAGFVVANV